MENLSQDFGFDEWSTLPRTLTAIVYTGVWNSCKYGDWNTLSFIFPRLHPAISPWRLWTSNSLGGIFWSPSFRLRFKMADWCFWRYRSLTYGYIIKIITLRHPFFLKEQTPFSKHQNWWLAQHIEGNGPTRNDGCATFLSLFLGWRLGGFNISTHIGLVWIWLSFMPNIGDWA